MLLSWFQLIVIGMWTPCGHAAAPGALPTVLVRDAKLTEVSQSLSYPATVEARVHATILAEADGVIRKIHATLGQKVSAGRQLVTVQQRDPIYRYAPVSTLSPVAGVVSELNVTEGTLVVKGQKLASVTDPKNLKVLMEIPAQDLQLLESGASGRMEMPALGEAIVLTLTGISPSVDSATGTATAELAPAPGDVRKLRPGMVGKVTFKAGSHQGFLVPEDALVEKQGETFLRIVKDGVAKKVPVKVGARMRGQAEITSGLEEGFKVVERASGFIAEGEAVKVEELKSEAKESAVN